MEKRIAIPYSRTDTEIRVIDIFLPDGESNGCCLFFVHGGAWRGGNRAMWHTTMERFCSGGFVCSSVGYHLMPAKVFPSQVEDVRLAMSFMKEHAKEYGFDPDRMVTLGSSAGAHLASMLALIGPEDDLGVSEELTVRDTRPAGVVCLCGVLSLHSYPSTESIDEMRREFVGGTEEEVPDVVRAASPVDRVQGDEPPFLMVVGDIDEMTPVSLHEQMRDALLSKGCQAELMILEGAKHGFGYGVETEHQKQTWARVDAFLERIVGAGTSATA